MLAKDLMLDVSGKGDVYTLSNEARSKIRAYHEVDRIFIPG